MYNITSVVLNVIQIKQYTPNNNNNTDIIIIVRVTDEPLRRIIDIYRDTIAPGYLVLELRPCLSPAAYSTCMYIGIKIRIFS